LFQKRHELELQKRLTQQLQRSLTLKITFHRLDTLPDKSIQFAELTPTENRVLELLARGQPNALIAEELKVKVGVVKLHCHHIYEKLHVKNRTEAAGVYLEKLNGRKNGF
jgi:DNA-binding NarL/FixJ family response regulator